MEVIRVVGIRPYAFTDDIGVNRSGYSLYCLVANEYVHGLECKKMSVSKDLLPKDIFDVLYDGLNSNFFVPLKVYYNSRGKISACELTD